jgi:quercetin dioxygenase-like cupin family protein
VSLINYIINRNGVLITETGEEHAVKEGCFALVLPNKKHQYKDKSNAKPFIIICAVPKDYEKLQVHRA